MIVRITDEKYLESFAAVYNSANTLFKESERGTAAPGLFLLQLRENENFAEITECGEMSGFISWSRRGKYFELTSLYVKQEAQRSGIGSRLLRCFEEQVQDGGILFVKVLKNAPWAENFYRRNGYLPPDESGKEIAASLNIREKSWSFLLCKRMEAKPD